LYQLSHEKGQVGQLIIELWCLGCYTLRYKIMCYNYSYTFWPNSKCLIQQLVLESVTNSIPSETIAKEKIVMSCIYCPVMKIMCIKS